MMERSFNQAGLLAAQDSVVSEMIKDEGVRQIVSRWSGRPEIDKSDLLGYFLAKGGYEKLAGRLNGKLYSNEPPAAFSEFLKGEEYLGLMAELQKGADSDEQ